MSQTRITVVPANKSTTGLASSKSSAGSTLTLDGALTSGGTFTSADGLGRQLVLTETSTKDQSSATFTITGTNQDQISTVEAVTGPTSGGTRTTTNYFLTVSSVDITAPVAASTVSLGTNGLVSSPTFKLEHQADSAHGYQTVVSGTINYSVAETMMPTVGMTATPTFVVMSAFSGQTGPVMGAGTVHASGARVTTASYTDGGYVHLHIGQ